MTHPRIAALAKSRARSMRRAARVAENAVLPTAPYTPAASQDAPGGPQKPKRGPRLNRTNVRGKTGKPKMAQKRPKLPKRTTLKSQIVRLLGLRDRDLNGNWCRMIPECPNKAHHAGSLAYHLVPAQRGDSTRFVPENVVWACSQANYGEVMNRSLYRDKHITLFGHERMERLEALARETRQYTRTELVELRDSLKTEPR